MVTKVEGWTFEAEGPDRILWHEPQSMRGGAKAVKAVLVIGEKAYTRSDVMAYEKDLIWAMSDPGRFTERYREEKVIGEPFEETMSQWVSRARAIVRAKHGLSDPA
jgi:hypothetical protein